ncbi:adhesive plaque matrix protein 2-like, partial [Actinia tenebrosa]|uniref:Adhesive plaque matrix protein 2-like n=1 Tax=Actinia tenebrosa TaxID=6105 RepID=A0A6P8IG08_ACTTE
MNIIRCFLCFWVVMNLSCDEVVDGLKDKTLEGPPNTIHSESTDEEDDVEDGSTSGTKKFEEPNYFDQSSQETNIKDTSSIVNEDLPDIRGKDVTPEQEMLMAATQDSDYQQASVGDVNGQVFGALTGRSLRRTSSTDEKENEGTSSEDNDSLSSDNLMGFSNFSESQGGDSEDQRQQIHYPVYHDPRPFGVHPPMKAPMPYPATIHVRLPGSVHMVPKVYPVHDYRGVPVPVRYHKVQNVDSPYYVPYKAGPDVEETHLDVFHPVNPCKNEGLLLHSNGGMVCLCTRDYQGRFCDEKLYCPSNPCLNGGVCDEIANNYRCRCPKGYRGYNCEVKDECALNPCKNDGTCVETLNGIICICRSGFTGQHCESPDFCVPNPCRHWGTCIQTHTGHHECQCTPHFKGHLCETRRICYANPCKNGGKCIEDGGRYPCICPHGYKPPFCREHVCSQHPCLNGGKCVAYGSANGWHYKCNCPLLYRGEHCEIPNPCVTNPCLHAGTCIDSFSEYSGFPADWNTRHLHYVCVCPPGYFGPKCEDNICIKCHKNATCISNRCVCNDGFYGDGFYCRHIIDPCVPNPCYNNATCTHGPDDSFDCHCPPGYIPPLCKDKDVCVP